MTVIKYEIITVKRLLVILGLTLCIGTLAWAQPQYSQYQYNMFLLNPSVAGSNGYTCVNMTARNQWSGYYGAPQTYSLSYQGRFLKMRYSIRENLFKKKIYKPKSEGKVGVGLNIYNDINGLVHKTGFLAAYSYHVWLSGETQLSLGLSVSGYYYKIDQRQIQFEDSDEPFLYSDFRKGTFIPDFNAGAYITSRNFAVGFSTQELMEGFVKTGSQAYKDLRITRSYYLFGNYVFQLNRDNMIEPSVLVKMSDLMNPQLDVGLTYIYDNKFWGGLKYRTGSSLVANVGITKEKYFFGYSFDYTFQEIQKSTYGSHELVVAIRFGSGSRKYRWLDRY